LSPAFAKRLGDSRRGSSASRRARLNRVLVTNLVDIATRSAGGIEVALIWNRDDEALVVFAFDAKTKEEVAIPVTREEAAEVYRHPFAYAHRARPGVLRPC
jgi:hypothetical protein